MAVEEAPLLGEEVRDELLFSPRIDSLYAEYFQYLQDLYENT